MLIVPSSVDEAGEDPGWDASIDRRRMPFASSIGRLHDQARAEEHDDERPEELPESNPHDAKRIQQQQRADADHHVAGEAAACQTAFGHDPAAEWR